MEKQWPGKLGRRERDDLLRKHSEQIRLPYNGKTYKDFDFLLKFKGEAEGNSGVFLRARITGMNLETGPDIQGMQVEVDPSIGKHTGACTKEADASG